MRADRLITTLLLLQQRGRMTARQLAEELEVSTRTVMRDLEALGTAGVPIYAERGPKGGFELWDGFRTQLSSVTADEVRAARFLGAPAVADEIGLGEDLTRFQLKLDQALPTRLLEAATAVADEFLLAVDPTADDPDVVDFFVVAVRRRRQVLLDDGRRLAPLGMVRGAAGWSVVALIDGELQAVPVSTIGIPRTTGKRFERPEGFDLHAAWAQVGDQEA